MPVGYRWGATWSTPTSSRWVGRLRVVAVWTGVESVSCHESGYPAYLTQHQIPDRMPCGHLVDDRAGRQPLRWKRPPGAFATPRGRLRVGWRGGSQLLQLHYNIDKIVTSRAEMPRRSSQNNQIGAHRRVPRPGRRDSEGVHSSVHRVERVAVDYHGRGFCLGPRHPMTIRESNQTGGTSCC